MKVLVVCAAVSMLATACWADESATRDASFDPVITDGKVVGCGISFDVVRKDPDYFENDTVQAAGSVYVFRFPGKEPGVGLKLGVGPLFAADAPYHRPSAVLLVKDYVTNKDDQISKNDGENGFTLTTFKFGAKTINAVVTAETTGHVSIGYAMTEGGRLDIFDVDLSVRNIDTNKSPAVVERDYSTVAKWKSCVDDLMRQAEPQGNTR